MPRRWQNAILLSFALGAALATLEETVAQNCTAERIETSSGSVCGISQSGQTEVRAYLGIPYGQSTAGANRWAPPAPVARKTETINATDFGPICPQGKVGSVAMSEDCLSLNVWTPAPASDAALPVMVFIHGGAFVIGSSRNPLYDAGKLAAKGEVVVVTLNYRLGALGFLTGLEGLSGNYGLLDQQLALKWVRDNIAGFGGDPGKVTLFGESAGAMSVGLHLVAPSSDPFFRAAIMQSNPYGITFKTPAQAKQLAMTLRDSLGCEQGGIDCMRSRSFQAVLADQRSGLLRLEGLLSGFSGYLVWAPVIDGALIPAQPVESAIAKPALIGSNRDEGELFAMTGQLGGGDKTDIGKIEYQLALNLMFPLKTVREIRQFARYQPRRGDNTLALAQLITDYIFTCANRHVMSRASESVFGYLFSHPPSYDMWPQIPLCAPDQEKVCHAFELPFVFGNPTTITEQPYPVAHEFTPAERALSEQLIGYWTRFATTLQPNQDGAFQWPPFQSKQPLRVIFDETLSTESELGANCGFWDSLGYAASGAFH